MQLPLQSEQISQGRSRSHCRAPQKKIGHLKQAIFRSADRSIAYSIRVLQLMPSSQNSEITTHMIWFVSLFTILSSLEKRVKKRARGNKSHKERFYMLECSWKKLDELFQCWKRSICFPTANIYFPNPMWLCCHSWLAHISGQKILASPSPWLLRQIGTRSRERIFQRLHRYKQNNVMK